MRGLRPWQLAVCALLLCAGVLAALLYWRTRPELEVRSQLRRLPGDTGAVFFVNVGQLRRSGILHLMDVNRAAEEPDYRAFVNATGFDWKQDLDSVLTARRDQERFFLLTGRFDWQKISRYARTSPGGECLYGMCRLNGTQPDTFISMMMLRTGVLAMAVSNSKVGAGEMGRVHDAQKFEPPADPIWLYLPQAALKPDGDTPAPVTLLMTALSGLDRALLAMGGTVASIEVRLEGDCAKPETAGAVAARLRQATDTLKGQLAREGKTFGEADLAGVLTAGTFSTSGTRVNGRWPLSRPFIEALVR